jgi:plastocyanin
MTTRGKRTLLSAAMTMAMVTAFACGGSGGGGTSPTPVGSPGPSGATITITSAGVVSPSSVTINNGESVTFVNSDSRVHEMASDPHPAHTDCPPINALGTLQPGQSRLTNAMTTSRTCGFHDHLNDSNPNLRGTIVIR